MNHKQHIKLRRRGIYITLMVVGQFKKSLGKDDFEPIRRRSWDDKDEMSNC
jgi:hypothetical protein